MEALPVEQLLDRIRKGLFGQYYNIWRAVGRRSTLEDAGWVLFEVLESDVDYLYRYHCAAALLKLLGDVALAPVDLSGNHSAVEGNISSVRSILEGRIGPPPQRSASLDD